MLSEELKQVWDLLKDEWAANSHPDSPYPVNPIFVYLSSIILDISGVITIPTGYFMGNSTVTWTGAALLASGVILAAGQSWLVKREMDRFQAAVQAHIRNE